MIYLYYFVLSAFIVGFTWQLCELSDEADNPVDFWVANIIYGVAGAAILMLVSMTSLISASYHHGMVGGSIVYVLFAMFLGSMADSFLRPKSSLNSEINFYS